ncbi:DUF2189 domain-containing protein [Sinisalibacter lacisalsi]|uniref:Membrane protein n=1 Tax=Sinisalibacter lacisalsi TaxID=1526570 RepID=A0ABQ1QM45_9RHOB|nr:DUF2189 domain-containing protein [Sinisalibacter lacisalsi]GGD31609.1 membrane protein [Sinisalibacter lacisalsi]
MSDATATAPSSPPNIGRVQFSDIGAVLRSGWRDFTRAPLHGLFFASFFVIAGLLIFLQLDRIERSYSIIPLAFGFPLLAPFLAMGLYDVSRRLEQGRDLPLAGVLRVVYRQKDRQCPSMAAVIIVIFLFWVFIAHMIFALFLGFMPMTNISTDWAATILTSNGLSMLAFGGAVGAGLAFVLFSITVMGLPLLLDREIDFISAMIYSFQTVMANLVPMLAWALVIAALTLLAMLPYFLGLFVVLPVLGHATWHLYRRAMTFDSPGAA